MSQKKRNLYAWNDTIDVLTSKKIEDIVKETENNLYLAAKKLSKEQVEYLLSKGLTMEEIRKNWVV